LCNPERYVFAPVVRHNLHADRQIPAAERGFTVSRVVFSVAEIAHFAALIARGGKGKTRVVQAMPR
jgi:hypothetical protein